MKNFRFALSFLVVSASPTLALALDNDGCFQMYQPSVMYPVICVDGSKEEGMGGSRARVAVVGPNSLVVKHCDTTTKILNEGTLNAKKVTFHFTNGTIFMEGAVNPQNQREDGSVTIGKSTFKYMRLLPDETSRLLKAVYDSGTCDK